MWYLTTAVQWEIHVSAYPVGAEVEELSHHLLALQSSLEEE
jgi:hypothetical protein